MAVFKQSSLSPPHFVDFIRRNLTLIVLSGSIVAFWMLIYTFAVYKPTYSAKALVIIKDSALTRRFVEPEQYYAMQTTTSSSSNPVLNTMGILKSSAISDAVYEYFKAHHPEQLQKMKILNKEDWAGFFGDGSAFIKAKNQSGTDIISIQFAWSNPLIAKESLEVVVTAFQYASRDLNQQEQVSRTRFMDRQMRDIEAQLEAIRRQKSSYQSHMGVVSVGREGDDLSSSRTELTNQLNQIEARAQGKAEQLKRYEAVLDYTPEQAVKAVAMGQSLTMNKLQDELYRLQQQYAQQVVTLGDQDPLVRETRAQIMQARANIRTEQTRTTGNLKAGASVGPVVMDTARNTMIADMVKVQGEAQDLQTQAVVLRNRLGKLDRQIQEFPEAAEGLVNIEQRESSLSVALDQLRQKVLEGRLKEAQTLSNVFIVDAANLPEQSQFPSRNHLLALSLVLGLTTGLAVAVGKEQLFPEELSETPDWLEPLEDEDEPMPEAFLNKHSQNGSFFDSLVSIPVIEDVNPRTTTIKQNPYMHAPQKTVAESSQLHAALRDALKAQQNQQPV